MLRVNYSLPPSARLPSTGTHAALTRPHFRSVCRPLSRPPPLCVTITYRIRPSSCFPGCFCAFSACPSPCFCAYSMAPAPSVTPRTACVPPRDRGLAISTVLGAAIDVGAVGDTPPVALFFDLTAFRRRCDALVAAFPPTTLHGFAVKANPVVAVVAAAAAAGLGAEVASIGEAHVALAAGVPPARIVYDSPAKTDAHLTWVLSRGIHINVDNVEELERLAVVRAALLSAADAPDAGEAEREAATAAAAATVGLRVNPQLGTASISATFTASATSKFGEPLRERRSAIVAAVIAHPFVRCLHVHVGSQGVALDVLVGGASAVVDLASEINDGLGHRQVDTLDIGGGMSVDYNGDDPAGGPTFDAYVSALRSHTPKVFDFRLVTEFGRSLASTVGWVGARVEGVKRAGGRTVVVCHAGADLFMRAAYAPNKWHHRVELYGPDGAWKGGCGGPAKGHCTYLDHLHHQVGEEDADSVSATANGSTNEEAVDTATEGLVTVDIAGPLCFSGDIIARDRLLPAAARGDWVVVREAGAYTLSAYCRHTSQLVPAVWGYDEDAPAKLKLLKKAETPADVVSFWSA